MNKIAISLLFVFLANGVRSDDSPVALPEYKVVRDWPQLPAEVKLGPVSAVAIDRQDRVFVAHRGSKPILLFDPSGKLVDSWGHDSIKTPHGLRIDRQGNLWLTDIGNHLVLKFDPQGKLLQTFGKKGEPGTDTEHFDRPTDIAFAPNGDFFITDGYGNSRVLKFAANGKFINQWGSKGKKEGEFNLPHSICIDDRGRLLVGDRENDRVQVFDQEGRFLSVWKESGAPYGLHFFHRRLFVADGRANWIKVLDDQGKPLGRWGEKGALPGQFQMPHMLSVDSHGTAYVAEVNGRRIQKFIATPVPPSEQLPR